MSEDIHTIAINAIARNLPKAVCNALLRQNGQGNFSSSTFEKMIAWGLCDYRFRWTELGEQVIRALTKKPIQPDELTKAKADAEMLVEENTRLRKYVDPEWFYLAGDMSSDRCWFSVHEVIDEDWLWDNRAEGFAVVQIETATRCPDIWALVHFFTDEEKDARQSDDEYEIIEFATEAEAKAALASYREKN